MKCIKNLKTGEIVRVADKQAHQTVGSQWSYVAKSEWKKATRVKVEAVVVAETKGEETKAHKAKRHSEIKAKQRPAEATDKILK